MVSLIIDNPTLTFLTYILTYYVYSAILILGSVGNILNILLFFRKKLRNISCNNYFLAAAFTNLIALNVTIGSLLYKTTYPDRSTIIICKIESYIMNAFLQMSRYLILMACIDRYALCSRNARLRKFCHIRIARRYIIPFIILIWLIIPLHVPIYSTLVNYSCVFIGFIAVYNTYYGIIMIGIIPPVLMLIFTILIFRNLKLRQQRRQIQPVFILNNIRTMNQNRYMKIKDQQVLAMLVILVIVYAISSTPYTAIRLYLLLKSRIDSHTLIENDSTTIFVLFVTDILRFICPFASFYLLICVSHLYRKEMKLMFSNILQRCIS